MYVIVVCFQKYNFPFSVFLGGFHYSLNSFKCVPNGDLEGIFFLTNWGYARYFSKAEKQLEKAKKKFCFH